MDKFKVGDKVRLISGKTLPSGPHSRLKADVVYEVRLYLGFYGAVELEVSGEVIAVLEEYLEKVNFPGMPDEHEQSGPIAVIESFY